MAVIKDYDVIKATAWHAPAEGGAKLLTMPNVPKPLHGKFCQPRTILRPKDWNIMRKSCYENAGYICEACGKPCEKGKAHAHELFDIDYTTGTSQFIRCVCLDPVCHVLGVHSGRMKTLYKHGSPIMTRESVLMGAENLFSILAKYNKDHPDEEPLRAYATWLEFLKLDIGPDIAKLIDEYDIKFYEEDVKKQCKWVEWKLVFNGKEYPTPYKDIHEWEEAMKKNNKTNDRAVKDPFTGGGFDMVKKLLANQHGEVVNDEDENPARKPKK